MEQMLFGLGALCTVLLGVLVYVFIMTIQSIRKFKSFEERMQYFSRAVEEFSSNAWRHREESERFTNNRIDAVYQHIHMDVEKRIEKLEEKMIPKEAKKEILKG
jgi:hypothetical protein